MSRILLVRLSAFRSMFSLAGAQAVNPLPPELDRPTSRQSGRKIARSRRSPMGGYALQAARNDPRVCRREASGTGRYIADVRRRHAAAPCRAVRGRAHRHSNRPLDGSPSGVPLQGGRRTLGDKLVSVATGDARLGIRLVINSGPMWLSLGVLGEYVAIVDDATDRLWQDPGIDAKDAIWLAPSLHLAQFNVAGITASMAPMLSKALQLAEQQGDLRLPADLPVGAVRSAPDRGPLPGEPRLRAPVRRPGAAPGRSDASGNGPQGGRAGEVAQRRSAGADHMLTSPWLRSSQTRARCSNKSLIYKQGVAARASASNFLWLTGFADQAVVQAADGGGDRARARRPRPLLWPGASNRAAGVLDWGSGPGAGAHHAADRTRETTITWASGCIGGAPTNVRCSA